MGAGSAKGVQPEENEDEVDSFSSTSSDQWEREVDTPATPAPPSPVPPPPPAKSKPKPPAPPVEAPKAGTSVARIENEEEKKDKPKKKTTFGFTLRREHHSDKIEDVNDSSDDEGEREREKKARGKLEKEKDKKGFRLFGWRKEEKKTERDGLDDDIDDLEKTFDSLGIVGKNMWAPDGKNERKIEREEAVLSPMRKRKNVKGRGKTATGQVNGSSSGSNASKRTFRFSWETEKQKSPPRDEGDEWEYKAVVIEGFDIEKFRKANHKESVFDSNSLPNVVGGEEDPASNSLSSPLRYDQTEQYILASIERDFAN
ncbi:U2 snRNP-associated SURP motif-containing protein-like [Scylla paramamosain]|uniref:U2 snRNP-associated SURP motif-containing protein-like n=1 Tax=Scylla paramamosain TaxID=85552 RepID=UPI0030836EBE